VETFLRAFRVKAGPSDSLGPQAFREPSVVDRRGSLYCSIELSSWLAVNNCLLFVRLLCTILRSRDSVVGIVTGYGLDDRGVGVWVPVASRIFSSPSRPYRVWGPPNVISNGYRGGGGKAAGSWSWPLTSNKCRGLYIHSPIRLHGVVLN
jgi:hypothetical protein